VAQDLHQFGLRVGQARTEAEARRDEFRRVLDALQVLVDGLAELFEGVPPRRIEQLRLRLEVIGERSEPTSARSAMAWMLALVSPTNRIDRLTNADW
jgi:hypothetical protein